MKRLKPRYRIVLMPFVFIAFTICLGPILIALVALLYASLWDEVFNGDLSDRILKHIFK